MDSTAILIGQPALLRRLERQLDLLEDRPVTLGWITTDTEAATDPEAASGTGTDGPPVLGTVDELEIIIARRRPAIALITLPAAVSGQVHQIRTRLRRLGIPDRFMPTLEDQVAGIGPRTHLNVDFSQLLTRAPKKMDAEAVRNIIDGRRVLITGAGGSIGSELARIVGQFDPESLMLMDRSENALFEIDRQLAQRRPDLPRCAILHDVVDAVGTRDEFARLKPEIVFHTAAHKHVPMMEDHPGAAVDNNLFGTKSVADAADAIGTERFVMISSDKAVRPASIMGATKRLAELYVQHLNRRSATGFATVRFGNVLASSGSVLEIWMRQIEDGGPVTVTDPRMTRYFMTIGEAAALVIQSAALIDPTDPENEVFLLDMGEPLRILEMARELIRLHGLEPLLPDEVPQDETPGTMRIAFTGARPGEKLHEDLSFDAECMRPTRHPDINIWMVPPPNDRYVEEMILALAPGRRDVAPARLAATIRRLAGEVSEPVAA